MQINILASESINSWKVLILPWLLSDPLVHKLYLSSGIQSAKKPNFFNSVFLNEEPIERSGTATITFLMPWFCSLSRAINIKARDLPDAGGAFKSKYLEVL